MRHVLLKSAVSSGLLLFGLTATAQEPARSSYYDSDVDNARFLERVRADLDRAESTASSFNGDLERIATVRDEISTFQRRMDAGNYDPHALTEAIVSLQRVLDNNPLYNRTRDNLVMDLSRLRALRARYDGWR